MRMVGKRTPRCPHGCCRDGEQKQIKRVVKRREKQAWRQAVRKES